MSPQPKQQTISPAEQTRILRANLVFSGYAKFLRWTTTLPEYTVKTISVTHRIYDIGSGNRFAFYIEGKSFFLLAQDYEMLWVEQIPWNYAVFHEKAKTATVERKLYLVVKGDSLGGVRFKNLAVGINIGWKQFDFINQIKCDKVYLRGFSVSKPRPGTAAQMISEYTDGAVLPLDGLSINISPSIGEHLLYEEKKSALVEYANDVKALLRKLPGDIQKDFASDYGYQDGELLLRTIKATTQLEYPDITPEGPEMEQDYGMAL